ncbi:hypothetical protein GOP47_0027932 [Adiantum capillus-veneris]|nr:hypothetical protein GOP47_0027932 [Adiantum capillus-veneris]
MATYRMTSEVPYIGVLGHGQDQVMNARGALTVGKEDLCEVKLVLLELISTPRGVVVCAGRCNHRSLRVLLLVYKILALRERHQTKESQTGVLYMSRILYR